MNKKKISFIDINISKKRKVIYCNLFYGMKKSTILAIILLIVRIALLCCISIK